MLKTKQKLQAGFTIIELLIVIAIIAILALLVLNNFQGAQAKARDTQRRTDMNNLHGKLEEYYNEKGAYPGVAITTGSTGNYNTLFPGMDEGSVKDADDATITSVFETTAGATTPSDSTNPDNSGGEYRYVGFDCSTPSGGTQQCNHYVLRAFIEKPAQTTDNPFVKKSLN